MPARDDQKPAADPLPPARIDRDSIPDLVYQAIRRDIARGDYKPGVLRIRPLTERFGVSATPIREALRRLEAEGLVTLRNRRIMVRSVSQEEIREIFAIRKVLERFAIAEAARHGVDGAALDRLDGLVAEMDATADADPERWREANEQFHRLIYEQARSPRLLSIIDSLWVAVAPYMRLYVHATPGLASSQDQHRTMVDALRAGDAERAADAMGAHLTATEEMVLVGFAEALAAEG